MKNWFIRRQLRRQGATHAEAKDLAAIANELNKADLPSLDDASKAAIAAQLGIDYNSLRPAMRKIAAGAVACMIAVVYALAQSAQPGSALYGIKESTTKVRIIVQETLPFIPDDEDEREKDADDSSDDATTDESDDRENESEDRDSSDRRIDSDIRKALDDESDNDDPEDTLDPKDSDQDDETDSDDRDRIDDRN